MDTEKKPNFEEIGPLPNGVKLRTRKFGAKPVTPLVSVPTGRERTDAGPTKPMLQMRGENLALGLSVLLYEQPASGRLVADVFCTNSAMLNKAAVSVALVGKDENEMIRKSIPLDQPDNRTGGCCGSADFGLPGDAIHQFGTELRLVVFLLM